jgi:hypothetical protein
MPKTITIHHGRNVTVKIFRTASKHVAKDGTLRTYTSHVVRWTDLDGIPRELKRNKLADARREGEAKAEQIAKGSPTTELSQADVASFKAAVGNLYGTGKRIEVVTADFAEGHKLAPDKSHAELARFYAEHQPRTALDLTVPVAVKQLLAKKKTKGASARWLGTLESQLNAFAEKFPGAIVQVTAEQIEDWVLSLKVKAVTRNNYLAAVQSLYSLPALAHAPHRESILAIEPSAEDEAAKVPDATQRWTPEEFRLLLDTALQPFTVHNKRTRKDELRSHRHLLPVLVLGGFCKMRSESEVLRADWKHVEFADRQIYANGKTGERLATLTRNAVPWLKLSAQKAGPIWPWGENKLHRDLRALARRCNLTWRANALRKSATTYAMKLNPDAGEVSDDAGNSPAVMRKYYLRLGGITKAMARQWFGILPPKNSRVIVPLKAATA